MAHNQFELLKQRRFLPFFLTAALGAAYLAGLAEGVWPSLEAVAAEWAVEAQFEPNPQRVQADLDHAAWRRAVDRSRDWILH